MTARFEYGINTGGESFINPKRKMPLEIKAGKVRAFFVEGDSLTAILSLVGDSGRRNIRMVQVSCDKSDEESIIEIFDRDPSKRGLRSPKDLFIRERIVLKDGESTTKVRNGLGFKATHVRG